MIGNFQELNRSDDVEIPEIGEKMEQGDPKQNRKTVRL